MKVEKTIYSISREELPLIKKLENLENTRSFYFDKDFKRSKDCIEETNRKLNRKREVLFFFDLIEKMYPNIKTLRIDFSPNHGEIIIEAKNILSEIQQKRLLKDMEILGETLIKVYYITIDIREEELYQKAITFENGIEVLDNWMINHYLYQFHYSLNDNKQIIKVENGVYKVPCTYEILGKEEVEIKDFHRMFQDIKDCLEQDILGFKEEIC